MQKICTTCKILQPLENYYGDNRASDKKQSQCKECFNLRSRNYYKKNKKKLFKSCLAYRKKNPDKVKQWGLNYRQRHREEIRLRYKKYREQNRDKILAKKKAFYKANKEKIKQYWMEYKANNQEKFHLKHKKTNNRARFSGLKPFILERDNYSCLHCGMTNKQHIKKWGYELTIDHIDGKGSNVPVKLKNNEIDNLQTLCMSCHGKKDALRGHGKLIG